MEIEPEDLLISSFSTQRDGWSTGLANGIQIVHRPTGIEVTCDTERSQYKNRVIAMKMLQEEVDKLPDILKAVYQTIYEFKKAKKEKILDRLAAIENLKRDCDLHYKTMEKLYHERDDLLEELEKYE